MVRNGSLDIIRQKNAQQNSGTHVLDRTNVTPENIDFTSQVAFLISMCK